MSERFGYDDAAKTADAIRSLVSEREWKPEQIRTGMIIGSGLGGFPVNKLNATDPQSGLANSTHVKPVEFRFGDLLSRLDINDGKSEGVQGHAKRIVIGPTIDDTSGNLVFAQDGREHIYEHTDMRRATFWLRVMQILGVRTLIGSNAAGILTPETLTPPALMLVNSDQDTTGKNPLQGKNEKQFGPRFPHMGDVYSSKLRNKVLKVADELRIQIREGLYIREAGPNYESPETVYRLIELLQSIWARGQNQPGETRFQGPPVGGVGMSSTYEAMVAQHARQSDSHPAFHNGTIYISTMTNYAAGRGPNGFGALPNHEEVIRYAAKIQDMFERLVLTLIHELTRETA